MSQRIIFQLNGRPASVLIPAIPQMIMTSDGAIVPAAAQLTIEQIGQKDVPPGVPFWIVDEADIPADRTFREAWELDEIALGEPSGYGGAE